MTESDRPTKIPGAVKATALRMDAITDVAGIIALTALTIMGVCPPEWCVPGIVGIVGMDKVESIRKRGGAVLSILGVLGVLGGKAIG